MQQMRQHQACRSGTDDSDLRAHGSSLFPRAIVRRIGRRAKGRMPEFIGLFRLQPSGEPRKIGVAPGEPPEFVNRPPPIGGRAAARLRASSAPCVTGERMVRRVGTRAKEEIPVPNHSFVTFIPKAIVPVIALAGMASPRFSPWPNQPLRRREPADRKQLICAERCMARFKDDIAEQRSCGARTCNHQYKTCLNNSAGGPERPERTVGEETAGPDRSFAIAPRGRRGGGSANLSELQPAIRTMASSALAFLGAVRPLATKVRRRPARRSAPPARPRRHPRRP